ncbi:MAG: HAD hydrolase-like protein [Azoarcus sp.]|nr:HAD hydrolase-like protein [Azoarcus sp.]
MPCYQHVIFDLDGTLIDSAPAILSSFRDAFATLGITPELTIEDGIIGPPLTETLELLSGSTDPALIARLSEQFKASYDTSGLLQTAAYDGIDELLARLKEAGLSLSIATNKRIHPTRLILDHLGWGRYFDAIYALDLFQPRLANKAAMIGRLLADRKIPLAAAVYIGDRTEDGESADANQLPFIATTWGYGSVTAEEMAPHWRAVDTPAALMRTLLS